MEFSLLGAAVIAAVGLYGVLWYEAGRTNPAESARELWDLVLGAAVIGLVAGRLAAMIRGGTNPISHPGDILIVRGGVDTVAASLSALGALGIMARRDLWVRLDAIAPAVLGGLAAWHGACLARSACLGTPSGLPWAFSANEGGVTRHPTELYAATLLILGVVVLIWWKRHHPAPGAVAGIALAVAAGVRLATEPLRPVLGSGLEWWYLAAVVAGLGVALGRVIRSRSTHR
ncbi:MAG TPA: prolipoprotein diacylglyceryl transferase family protein [Gemmatimonadales bacterium]|nr:prolipoprotein diacylglyceryl transferase family protein [Gemmatimonadales bacterium]